MGAFRLVLVALEVALAVSTSLSQVTTSHYDNSRSGVTLNELTPRNVNARQFWKEI